MTLRRFSTQNFADFSTFCILKFSFYSIKIGKRKLVTDVSLAIVKANLNLAIILF